MCGLCPSSNGIRSVERTRIEADSGRWATVFMDQVDQFFKIQEERRQSTNTSANKNNVECWEFLDQCSSRIEVIRIDIDQLTIMTLFIDSFNIRDSCSMNLLCR